MAESGIKINGKTYAIPQSLRVGETRQIKRITGLNPPEFMKAVNTLNETQDPDVGAAMVWWILHREDSSFTIELIDDLEWGDIQSEGGDDPKADGETSGSGSGTSDSSPTSAERSSPIPEAPGETIPANGGGPALALSAPVT